MRGIVVDTLVLWSVVSLWRGGEGGIRKEGVKEREREKSGERERKKEEKNYK